MQFFFFISNKNWVKYYDSIVPTWNIKLHNSMFYFPKYIYKYIMNSSISENNQRGADKLHEFFSFHPLETIYKPKKLFKNIWNLVTS